MLGRTVGRWHNHTNNRYCNSYLGKPGKGVKCGEERERRTHSLEVREGARRERKKGLGLEFTACVDANPKYAYLVHACT